VTNFIIIGICLIAGMLFRRSKLLPAEAHRGINAWLIYLALPAVSFKYLPHISWNTGLLLPVSAPVIIWLGALLYIALFAAKNKPSAKTRAGLTLSTGLSNTSFMGFPLIAAFFGEKYIAIGVICDQVTFLLLATAGVGVAIKASEKRSSSVWGFIKKIATFPPFLGCVGALTIPHLIDIGTLNPVFDKLAGTVGPLALFSIGLQLQFKGWTDELKTISWALIYKLMLAPALVAVVAFIFKLHGIVTQVSIFEMAMPTLLSSSIVADDYELNPKLSNLIIGIGLILGFATTSLWWVMLQAFK